MNTSIHADDLEISGMGSSNGGAFDNVLISGTGRINTDVEANAVRISGTATFHGSVKALKMTVSGTGSVKGELRGGTISVSGTLRTEGGCRATKLASSGSTAIGGNVQAERIRSSGALSVGGGVTAEEVVSYGIFKAGGGVESEDFESVGTTQVGGLVNANRILLKIGGACSAKELGGEDIQVKANGYGFMTSLLRLFIRGYNQLTTELVEGTSVVLENTKAKVVRGDRVTIGPRCEIDLVEFKDTIAVHPGAVVRRKVQV